MEQPEARGSSGVRASVVALLVLCGFSFYADQQTAQKENSATVPATAFKTGTPSPRIHSQAGRAFQCDGRKSCGQMTSCEEAKFFLLNCPVDGMNGDRDGVPCEQQWCK